MAKGLLSDPESGWSAWDYVRYIIGVLTAIRDNTEQESDDNDERRIRRPFVIPLDAAGNGQVYLALNPGNSLNLLTYGYQLTGLPAGTLLFYRDEEQGTGLLLNVALNTVGSGNFNSEGHFLPPQTQLLVAVRGGPANGLVSGNVAGINNITKAKVGTPGGGDFS